MSLGAYQRIHFRGMSCCNVCNRRRKANASNLPPSARVYENDPSPPQITRNRVPYMHWVGTSDPVRPGQDRSASVFLDRWMSSFVITEKKCFSTRAKCLHIRVVENMTKKVKLRLNITAFIPIV